MAPVDSVHDTRLVVAPGKVVLGRDAVEQLGDYAATYGSTALVVATEQIFDIHGERVLDILGAAGVETVPYTSVQPDPTVDDIEEAFERWRTEGCDVIVTLGGGSSIDAGKGVGILASNAGSIRDFGVDRAGYEGVPNPTPPILAVNTTTGTGSEATRSVVVTDEATATKFLIVSKHVVPDVAIEDRKKVHHFVARDKFASIITWQGGLTLTLSLTLDEVDDPLGLCTARVERGTWGVGRTQAYLTAQSHVAYGVRLIKQAYAANVVEP